MLAADKSNSLQGRIGGGTKWKTDETDQAW